MSQENSRKLTPVNIIIPSGIPPTFYARLPEESRLEPQDRLLLQSAVLNDIEGCEIAFNLGANPNACEDNLVTAIHIASEKGFAAYAKKFIEVSKKKEKYIKLNGQTVFGYTPLVLATMHDNMEVLDVLLEGGANPNVPHIFERTPMHIAAFFGRVVAAAKLIKYNAEVNAVDCFDQTPLSLSLLSKHNYVLVKLLLASGANPNFRNKSSIPILSLAVLSIFRRKDLKMINFLLHYGADINAVDHISHESALHKAAQTGFIPVIGYLIKKGADVFLKNIYGETPVHTAIRFKNREAADEIIKSQDEKDEEELNLLIEDTEELLEAGQEKLSDIEVVNLNLNLEV